MNMRVFLFSLLVVILTAIVFLPAHSTATQSEAVWVWCESETSAPTVYFTGPFDSGLSARSTTFATTSVARQFAEYLKGRYPTRTDATCGRGVSERKIPHQDRCYVWSWRHQHRRGRRAANDARVDGAIACAEQAGG